jgi:cell division protease FtsH
MVTEYGMSEKLGPLTFGHKTGEVFLGRDLAREPNYSPEVAYEIDKEVRAIIEQAYERARQILSEKREFLDRLAQTLIEKETITSDQLYELFEKNETPDEEPAEEPVEELSREKAKLDALGKLAPELKNKLRPAES